ncbi:MAG: hypothetical protein GYB65_10910 [Chloroflexi bacterium]|nr:hypothetical protein [Chloroflexota bacterium]
MAETTASIPIYILTPDKRVAAPYRASSLADAIAHEPQGVYTVARTYQSDHALLLDAHLDRLEQSARLAGIPLHLDRDHLRTGLRTLLHEANYADAKFRITVPETAPTHIYLSLEPFRPVPDAIQQVGAHVITVPLVRENPVVKTTAWMMARHSTVESLPEGIYEGIMLSEDQRLLEGMSSNFYGVLNGTLFTAGNGVLEGITRKAVIACVPDDLPLEMTALHRDDILHLSEAMLTSSGRGVVPITSIDGQPVGSGNVGPLVKTIRQRYDDWAMAHIKPI